MGQAHELAQVNIARAIAPLDDPVMQGFVDQLDYINSVADRAPGFVWRLQTEDGDSTAIRAFADPLIIVNMSVWDSIESLYRYVFKSDHLGPVRDRRSWFQKMDRPHSALWWVPAGHRPSLDEAKHKLDWLHRHGPGPTAFTFTKAYDANGSPVPRDSLIDRECGV